MPKIFDLYLAYPASIFMIAHAFPKELAFIGHYSKPDLIHDLILGILRRILHPQLRQVENCYNKPKAVPRTAFGQVRQIKSASGLYIVEKRNAEVHNGSCINPLFF